MELHALVHKVNDVRYTFYVTEATVPAKVAGVVFNNVCHLFEADEKPGFETSAYKRLIAKVKSKFGVASVRKHEGKQLVISETGKQFAIEGKCLKTNKDISEGLVALLSST